MTMPNSEERMRVNMGLQCPECHSVDIGHRSRSSYECRECGCNWDRRYYPALVIQEKQNDRS